MTIGDPASWSIPTAQAEARRLQALIDQGRDPRIEKAATVASQQAQREAAKVERAKLDVTGLDAWAAYCEDRKPHWGLRNYADHLAMVAAGGQKTLKRARAPFKKAGPMRALLDRPLARLDSAAIDEWVTEQTPLRPTRTALGFRLLRAFLNWCAEHPQYAAIACADAHRSKRTREKLARKRAKNDVLAREMLAPWFREVGKLTPPVSAALQFLLLTGCRLGEALDLKWEDVDFQWQRMTLRDKVEGARVVPLTRYLSTLLENLKRTAAERPALPRRLRSDPAAQASHEDWEASPWVFVARPRSGEKLTPPRHAHKRALVSAGLPHVSLHGLRRSFGTLTEWVEVPAGVVAQLQGHKPSATAEKHYRVRPLDLLRVWHQRIEDWMLEQAGVAAPHEKAASSQKSEEERVRSSQSYRAVD